MSTSERPRRWHLSRLLFGAARLPYTGRHRAPEQDTAASVRPAG